jgi:hypothetical protein
MRSNGLASKPEGERMEEDSDRSQWADVSGRMSARTEETEEGGKSER